MLITHHRCPARLGMLLLTLSSIAVTTAMVTGSSSAARHLVRTESLQTRSRRLNTVWPSYAGAAAANEDLEAFRRWCAGENSLGDSVDGMECLSLSYTPDTGLGLHAACDCVPGDIFRVPSSMSLPSSLEAAKVTMADRLGGEQLAMLECAQELTRAQLGRDLSMKVLLWQLIVDAHASHGSDCARVTPNPSSGLEPWLRTYRYVTLHPSSWDDTSLEWVSPLPWAWHLIGSRDWCTDQRTGELCRTTERFCESILPTLVAEFPSQLPPSHFTPEGFHFVGRLHFTHNMGGMLVPLHDMMEHDFQRHNVAGLGTTLRRRVRGLDDSTRRLWRSALGVCPRGMLTPLDESFTHEERWGEERPEQCYIARAVKGISAGY